MIIPKSKCQMVRMAVESYISNHPEMTAENREIMACLSDKLTLVVSGDATGLMIQQVYDPRIAGKKIIWDEYK